MVLPDPTETDTFNRAEAAAVREFKRRFPEIFKRKYRHKYAANPKLYGKHNWDRVRIELHRSSGIVVEDLETDLLAIAGGVAPDVLYVNFRKSDNYIRNGFLYPLDKPKDRYLTAMSRQEKDFRINPKIWPVIRRKGPRGAEHVWAIPFGGAVGRVLMYRKDLFDELNVPYPTIEWTWQDLLAACRKLTDPKNGIYALRFYRGQHESWEWITFLWSAGGDVMVYDKQKDQWRCVFDSREAAVALDFYTQLCTEEWTDKEGKTRRGYAYKEAGSATKWERGQIAMSFEYMDEKLFSKLNPEVVGMVPVPLGPPDKNGSRIRAAELNSKMMG
ncbi:unnamed protein product, partial [marine sediment metagenome]